jgi:hypothetical protein
MRPPLHSAGAATVTSGADRASPSKTHFSESGGYEIPELAVAQSNWSRSEAAFFLQFQVFFAF